MYTTSVPPTKSMSPKSSRRVPWVMFATSWSDSMPTPDATNCTHPSYPLPEKAVVDAVGAVVLVVVLPVVVVVAGTEAAVPMVPVVVEVMALAVLLTTVTRRRWSLFCPTYQYAPWYMTPLPAASTSRPSVFVALLVKL